MKRYMLDTNTVSHLLKRHALVVKHVVATPITSLCISAITQGELLFGLAKRPHATTLHHAVWELLKRLDTVPWDAETAKSYGVARSETQRHGRTIAPLDLLIGAHALSLGAVLVTNDKAFANLKMLAVEDWTRESH